MQRKCMKCSHVNEASNGHELEGCPQCGAIYTRVEDAIASGQFRPAPHRATATPAPSMATATTPPIATPIPAPTPAATPAVKPTSGRSDRVNVNDFAQTLRNQSLYPNFRSLVRLFYWLWILMAVCAGLGTVTILFTGSGPARIVGLIIGVGSALFFVLSARITTEVSLMMADLSDAAVRIAAHQSSGK